MNVYPGIYKKLLCAFSLVLLAFAVGAAQPFPKADSLKNIIASAAGDSVKIEAYNDLFPIWINKDLDSSRYYTAKGYDLAKKAGISKGIADLSVYTAYVDIRRRHFERAHQILDQAYSLLKKDGDYKPGEFHVLNWKAVAYREEGKTDSAKYTLKEIIEASASEFPQNTISAWFTLGDIASLERNFYEAINYFQQVDSLCVRFNKTENVPACASALANIGVIFKEELLQLEKALAYLTRAKQLYADRGETILMYEVDIEIAEIYFIQKSYDEAAELLNASLDFFREQGIVKKQLLALNVLNKLYLATKDYDQASAHLNDTHTLSLRLKDTFNVANALIHKGFLNTDLGNYKEAEDQLNSGLELAGQIQNKYLEGVAYKGFTKLYTAMGDYEKALPAQAQFYHLQLEKEKEINGSKLSELETRYQTEKKEQKIALLASENNLVAQQKKTQKIVFLATSGILLLGVLSIFMLYRNREKTTKKLKELDKIRTRFFSNLSHEFRTPLTLISGPVEHQLSKKDLPDDDKLDLRLIQRNANRMVELIDQLLELSHLDAAGKKLSVGYYNLALFVNQLSESFQYQAEKQGLKFRCNITGIKMAWFDREILHKILSNLLSNAIKYTDKDGYITVEVKRKNKQALFAIANSSSQLNDGEMQHIFTRFYQSDPNRAGAGIGLSLVKELVSVNRGDITVTKTKANEVRFTVMLPVAEEAFAQPEIVEGHTAEETEPFLNGLPETAEMLIEDDITDDKPVLLIVDDNEDICLFVENMFKGDYRVLKAENGLTGVQKAVEVIPDMVISDIMMPVKDGIYLANTLKNDERTSHIPIVLLTAKSGNHNEISGLKTGADAYIVKPFRQEKLRVLIDNLLKNRQLVQKRFKESSLFGTNGEIVVDTKDEQFAKRLQDVLANNLTETSFNAVSFSEAMYMSRMQLHRKLKALTGQSTTEFIRDQRLKLARQLLSKTDVNVSEIAYRVGFNQPAYFATCFKEVYKVPPSEYAEQCKRSR